MVLHKRISATRMAYRVWGGRARGGEAGCGLNTTQLCVIAVRYQPVGGTGTCVLLEYTQQSSSRLQYCNIAIPYHTRQPRGPAGQARKARGLSTTTRTASAVPVVYSSRCRCAAGGWSGAAQPTWPRRHTSHSRLLFSRACLLFFHSRIVRGLA